MINCNEIKLLIESNNIMKTAAEIISNGSVIVVLMSYI